MADRAILPVALDSNGDIVSGAQAYFYVRGTVTPLTVYSDEGATTPHASPVVADAAGVFPPVFVTSAFKIDIQDGLAASLPGYPTDPGYISTATSPGAAGTTFAPITGNPATNVQAAIQNLTTLWNAVTAYGRTLIAATDATAARLVLGLKSGAIAEKATTAEGEAGTDDAKYMTALTTKAAIDEQRPAPYDSGEQAITISSKATLAHGLAAKPTDYTLFAVCKVSEHGWGVGEEMPLPTPSQNGGVIRNAQISADATNIYIRTGTTLVTSNDTGSIVTMTPASWRYIARAWV